MAQYDGSIIINTLLNTAGLKKGESDIRSSVTRISNIAKKITTIIGSAFAVGKLVQFGKEAVELGSDLQEVQNVVDVTFTTMSNKVNEFAKNAAFSAGLSETMAKRYVGTFGAMAKSFGFTEEEAYNMSTALTQLSGDVASFYNISQDEAYTKLKSVFTGETETLKDLGVVMTQSALDAYALANGFGKTTSAMTEQEKVALRYQFVMKQLSSASGDFIRTSDSWANQVRILKLQIDSLKATIGQGLINVLTPVIKVINILLEKLAAVASAFKSFTELITGKKSQSGSSAGLSKNEGEDIGAGYEEAAKGAESLASANNDAAKSAKDAEKAAQGQVSTLDKLNNLSSQSNGLSVDGTSPGYSGGAGYGAIFGETDQIEEGAGGLAEKIKEIFSNTFNVLKEAWESKGRSVIDSAKAAFSGLKESVLSVGGAFYEVFTNGAGLAWAESILERLRSMLDIIHSVASAFADAWNSGAGLELATAIFGMWTNINGLITSIRDSFSRIFSDGIGIEIWTNILGIITGVYNTIGNLAGSVQAAWDTAGIGDGIWAGILNIVNTILSGFHELSDTAAEWAGNLDFTPMLSSVQGLLEDIEPLVGLVKDGLTWVWENVLLPLGSWTIEDALPAALDAIGDALELISSVAETAAPILQAIWDNFLEPVAGFVGDAITGFLEVLGRVLSDVANNETAVAVLTEVAMAIGLVVAAIEAWNIVQAILDGLLHASPITWIITGITALIAVIALCVTYWDEIKAAVQKFWDKCVEIFSGIGQWFEEKFNAIKEAVFSVWNAVKEKTSNIWNGIKAAISFVINNIKAVISTALNIIKATWSTVWNAVKTVASNVWNGIKTTISTVINTVKSVISTVLNTIKGIWNTVWTGLKTTVVNIFSGIWNAIKGVINKILGGIEKLANGVVNGINTVIGALNNLSFDVPDWIPGIGGKTFGFDIPELNQVSIPRLATGAVIPANREFMAVLGDQKHGKNLEAPEDLIRKIVREETASGKNSGGDINLHLTVECEGYKLLQLIQKLDREQFNRTGNPSFQF